MDVRVSEHQQASVDRTVFDQHALIALPDEGRSESGSVALLQRPS